MRKLKIIDHIKNDASKRMDFSILEKLCKEHNLWPQKVVIRRPDAEELEEEEHYAGGKYYYGGDGNVSEVHLIMPYGYEIRKDSVDFWLAHEFRHMMVDKLPHLRSIMDSEPVHKIRGILVALVTFSSPATLTMMGISKRDIRDLDPEEIDADAFAATVTGKKRQKRTIKKFKESKGKSNEDTASLSSNRLEETVRWS